MNSGPSIEQRLAAIRAGNRVAGARLGAEAERVAREINGKLELLSDHYLRQIDCPAARAIMARRGNSQALRRVTDGA